VEYYTTVAQVIPVLVLALQFEVRLTDRLKDTSDWGWLLAVRLLMAFVLLSAFVGELLALLVVSSRVEPSRLLDYLIGWGVLVPLFSLFYWAAVLLFHPLDEWLSEPVPASDVSSPPPAADQPDSPAAPRPVHPARRRLPAGGTPGAASARVAGRRRR